MGLLYIWQNQYQEALHHIAIAARNHPERNLQDRFDALDRLTDIWSEQGHYDRLLALYQIPTSTAGLKRLLLMGYQDWELFAAHKGGEF
jgi:hypothetical protein